MSFIEKIEKEFLDKNYLKVINIYNESPDNTAYDNLSLEKIALSLFKNKSYQNTIQVVNKIDSTYISKNYLLNEIMGESLYFTNNIEDSYSYLKAANRINKRLNNAKVRELIVAQRLNQVFDSEHFDQCLNIALKAKQKTWLRILGHIAYSNQLFAKANKCFRAYFTLGGKLTYIDTASFSLNGDINTKEYVFNPDIIEKTDDSLFKSKTKTIGSTKLVVTFAPNNEFCFRSYNFNTDVLYVVDNTNSYYIFSARAIADYIKGLVKTRSYDSVSLVGSSKGSTGALILYNILSKELKQTINSVAFSPQVKLYPFNKNLEIPSYEIFSTIFTINPLAHSIMENFSFLPTNTVVRQGDKVTVFYGNKYTMDKTEVNYFNKNSGVNLVGLDYSGHTTSIPLTIPEGRTKKQLIEKYSDLHTINDKDFLYLGGGSTVNIVDEIWDIYQNPKMRLTNFI